MAMVLTYRQTSIDTGHLSRAQPMSLYDAAPYVSACTRVTDLSEKDLIRWLMVFEPARRLVFGELGFSPSAFYQTAVVDPFFDAGRGDIDLIVCDGRSPEEAIALECKRVKLVVVDPRHHDLNKLDDTKTGVGQANRLYDKFGFCKIYLAVITAVDASSQEDTNIPCRGIEAGATPDFGQTTSFKRIVEFPGRDDLKPQVGIMFIEVVQPSGISIAERVTVRVCVHHPAERRVQSDSVTNRIELIMRGPFLRK